MKRLSRPQENRLDVFRLPRPARTECRLARSLRRSVSRRTRSHSTLMVCGTPGRVTVERGGRSMIDAARCNR
jgi:hypothetical protein